MVHPSGPLDKSIELHTKKQTKQTKKMYDIYGRCFRNYGNKHKKQTFITHLTVEYKDISKFMISFGLNGKQNPFLVLS